MDIVSLFFEKIVFTHFEFSKITNTTLKFREQLAQT